MTSRLRIVPLLVAAISPLLAPRGASAYDPPLKSITATTLTDGSGNHAIQFSVTDPLLGAKTCVTNYLPPSYSFGSSTTNGVAIAMAIDGFSHYDLSIWTYDPSRGAWMGGSAGNGTARLNFVSAPGTVAIWKDYGSGTQSEFLVQVYDATAGSWKGWQSGLLGVQAGGTLRNPVVRNGVAGVNDYDVSGTCRIRLVAYDPALGNFVATAITSAAPVPGMDGVDADGTMRWAGSSFAGYDPGAGQWVVGATAKALCNFYASPTSGSAPLNTWFLDDSLGATAWSWDFGDGNTSTAESQLHTYATENPWVATLGVSNAAGSSTGCTQPISSCGVGTRTATVSGNWTVCGQSASSPVRVDFTGPSPWDITWSDGVVQTGLTANPSYRNVLPASTTTYTLTSVGRNSCPAGTTSGSATITVVPGTPPAPPTFGATGTCEGVLVSWGAAVTAATYDIVRYTTCGSGGTTIATGLTSTLYYDTTAAAGTTYQYKVFPRNICGIGTATACFSGSRATCSSACSTMTPVTDFSTTSDFTLASCGSSIWTVQASGGVGGSASLRAQFAATTVNQSSASDSRQYNLTTVPSSGLRLSFWNARANFGGSDDGAVIAISTSDSPAYRYVSTVNYPSSFTTPATFTSCVSGLAANQTVNAIRGNTTGATQTADLSPYLTASTTWVKLRFYLILGNINAPNPTWSIDDVTLTEGATASVPAFSDALGNGATGVLRSGTADAILSWPDVRADSYRVYRSTNPANIRTDPSSSLVQSVSDTNSASYSWTTTDGAPGGGLYCYKVYGYRATCGESDPGQN